MLTAMYSIVTSYFYKQQKGITKNHSDKKKKGNREKELQISTITLWAHTKPQKLRLL